MPPWPLPLRPVAGAAASPWSWPLTPGEEAHRTRRAAEGNLRERRVAAEELQRRGAAAEEEKREQAWESDLARLVAAEEDLAPAAAPDAAPPMHPDLLRAATEGASAPMEALVASVGPDVLLGTTVLGNTCLHISSMCGHTRFCQAVMAKASGLTLLGKTNSDEETPLVAAVRSGSVDAASALLTRCVQEKLADAIVKPDKDGCNALHHAIRSGHEKLALRLCAGKAPDPASGLAPLVDSECASVLSTQVNNYDLSPMFAAAMRNSLHVVRQLLVFPDSCDGGPFGNNALHAALRSGNPEITRMIVKERPWLALEYHGDGLTPVSKAVRQNMVDMLRVFLEHDPSLGYQMTRDGNTLLQIASCDGHVDVARELLRHCPDAPPRGKHANGRTCLHTAVLHGREDFVRFILSVPQLRQIINMQAKDGKTALHLAVEKCNPKIVEVLLSQQHIDTTVLDHDGNSPVWVLSYSPTSKLAKTLNWSKVLHYIQRADPRGTPAIDRLRKGVARVATEQSRDNVQQLAQRYMTNTSLVAILITTITFAAAFTLPGGYNGAGLPNMFNKVAFKIFLISDTTAMCLSFVVAFACIIARWDDYEYLVYYKYITEYIMWVAYLATSIAFSAGFYTVVASDHHWLAILISVLVAFFPIVTWLVVQLPLLKLKIQLGEPFYSDLLDMV